MGGQNWFLSSEVLEEMSPFALLAVWLGCAASFVNFRRFGMVGQLSVKRYHTVTTPYLAQVFVVPCILWRCQSGPTTTFGLRYSSMNVHRSIRAAIIVWLNLANVIDA